MDDLARLPPRVGKAAIFRRFGSRRIDGVLLLDGTSR